MKKYVISALAIALAVVSIASIAQSYPMSHSFRGMAGMMGMDSPDMQLMQKKMGAAKTDEERQGLMAEHQMQMTGKQGAMMGMNPDEMQAMRDSMQKKMSAAKTDEERQSLMAEQQKLMMERRAEMMSENATAHDMNGMPGEMTGPWHMMHKRMGMGM